MNKTLDTPEFGLSSFNVDDDEDPQYSHIVSPLRFFMALDPYQRFCFVKSIKQELQILFLFM